MGNIKILFVSQRLSVPGLFKDFKYQLMTKIVGLLWESSFYPWSKSSNWIWQVIAELRLISWNLLKESGTDIITMAIIFFKYL